MSGKCKICKKKFKRVTTKHIRTHGIQTLKEYIEKYGDDDLGSFEVTEKSINGRKKRLQTIEEKKKNGEWKEPWNKGLTKETNAKLAKMSKDRMGENNPVHKIKDKQKWINNCKSGTKAWHESRKGKSLEEFYGEEKAWEYKQNMSEAAKNRKVHGHTGKKHSKEAKQKMREKTLWMIENEKYPQTNTKPERAIASLLDQLKVDYLQNHRINQWHTCDFVIQNSNFVIEVQGDYWHANLKNPKIKNQIDSKGLTESQKKNIANDKRKETWCKNHNLLLIKIWEWDIENNWKEVVKCLKELLV